MYKSFTRRSNSLVLILLFTFSFPLFSTNSTTTNIVSVCNIQLQISSQAELDALDIGELVDGNLRISGDDITDLTNLRGLRKVNCSLSIYDCKNLISLDGLQELEVVNSVLGISGNDKLQDISALSNLDTTEVLQILVNPKLESLAGLESLRKVNDLVIAGNPLIENLRPLKDLKDVYSIKISSNSNLKRLYAFEGIETIGRVHFDGNKKLESFEEFHTLRTAEIEVTLRENGTENLHGFESLTHIQLGLIVANTRTLRSIEALQNVEHASRLILSYNDSLQSYCGLKQLFVSETLTRINIRNNLAPFESVEKVIEDCEEESLPITDLRLDLTTNNPNIGIYNSSEFTLTITNEGTATATNIAVDFANPEVVISDGQLPVVSQGTFNFFTDQIWEVGELVAGASATLNVNYFFLTEPFLYAEISRADGDDSDSTPANGNGQTAQEDDEVTFGQEVVPPTALADFKVNIFVMPDSVVAGEAFDLALGIENAGTIAPENAGQHRIYVSTDNIISEDDVLISELLFPKVLAGDTRSGFSMHNIPSSVPAGDYYLIIIIDADNEITELREDNNQSSIAFVVKASTSICPTDNEPVCDSNGVTYANACLAENAGVTQYTLGECMPDNGNEEEVDLELQLTATNPNVNVYQNTLFTLTLTNTGSATAQNIKVALPLTAGKMVLTGGTSPTLSAGDYNVFTDQIWRLATLAPNQSATLEIDLFFLAKPFVFSEVIAVTESDTDSTPNNGNGQQANEDDEAVFGAEIGTDNCNIILTIYDKKCDDSGTPTDPTDDTFNFKLKATANNGSSQFNLHYVDSEFNGIEDYDQEIRVTGRSIAAGGVTIQATDRSNNACQTTLTITPPATCSNDNGSTDEGGNTDMDLSLEINSTTTYNRYTSTTVEYILTNEGNASATGIEVALPLPEGAVNTAFTAEQGTFDLYNFKWNIPTLAVGATAVLRWELFTLAATEISGYAEVTATNETDTDSTPANGNGEVNEDDEASFTIRNASLVTNNAWNSKSAIVNDFKLYPVPTVGNATLHFSSPIAQHTVVEIFNINGQLVHQQELMTNKGFNQINLPTMSFPDGLYTIRLNKEQVIRLVKQ